MSIPTLLLSVPTVLRKQRAGIFRSLIHLFDSSTYFGKGVFLHIGNHFDHGPMQQIDSRSGIASQKHVMSFQLRHFKHFLGRFSNLQSKFHLIIIFLCLEKLEHFNILGLLYFIAHYSILYKKWSSTRDAPLSVH